jgi:hypothetical protein
MATARRAQEATESGADAQPSRGCDAPIRVASTTRTTPNQCGNDSGDGAANQDLNGMVRRRKTGDVPHEGMATENGVHRRSHCLALQRSIPS